MVLDYEVTMCSHPTQIDLAQFFSQVEILAGSCWLWTGSLTPSGYGLFRGTSAHRATFAWFVGPIEAGDHVHHRCRRPRCVNPVHLDALSATEHASAHWDERRPILEAMRRSPTHPGEAFEEEWRKPSDISQAEAARRMGMSTNRLNEIVAGKRAVTAETAVLFAALTGTSPQLWLHMQADHDLWKAIRETDTSRVEPIAKTR